MTRLTGLLIFSLILGLLTVLILPLLLLGVASFSLIGRRRGRWGGTGRWSSFLILLRSRGFLCTLILILLILFLWLVGILATALLLILFGILIFRILLIFLSASSPLGLVAFLIVFVFVLLIFLLILIVLFILLLFLLLLLFQILNQLFHNIPVFLGLSISRGDFQNCLIMLEGIIPIRQLGFVLLGGLTGSHQ